MLHKVARHRELLLTIAEDSDKNSLAELASQLEKTGDLTHLLVAAASLPLIVYAQALGVGGTLHLSVAQRALPTPLRKWALLEELLAAGVSVLYCSPQTRWLDSPWGYLHRDSDFEIASTNTGREQLGAVVAVDDTNMGWSRYAQSLVISHVNPTLFYATATTEAVHVAVHMQLDLRAASASMVSYEAHALTNELLAPAHDRQRRAGASVRVLSERCFGTGRGSVASAPAPAAISSRESPNAVLRSRDFKQRKEVLHGSGCAPQPVDDSQPAPRRLNWIVSANEPWPPLERCRSLDVMPLCEIVARVAVDREVIAAVSNKNIFHMLELYIKGIQAANITNALVVALDTETSVWLTRRKVDNYVKVLSSRTGATGNHATSSLKFKVLVDFLTVGCSVLLSDVDVIWVVNPFPHLYRDVDVEGMSDGWDTPTAYGYAWAGGALRIFARNSGMFYVQATQESNNMMKRLAHRMEIESTWDQTAYNEEQFYPSYGEHGAVGVSSRVMSYLCYLNSKTFFRFVRDDVELLNGYRPLSMHVNYHPEKSQRMMDLYAFYYQHEPKGIHRWNSGDGSRVGSECAWMPKEALPTRGVPLINRIVSLGKAEWGGVKWIEFHADGSMDTPWGTGRWGDAMTPSRPNRIFASFIGQTHLLSFEDDKVNFVSTRCSDGEETSGRLVVV